MLAKVIAADGQNKAVVEITGYPYLIVERNDGKAFKVHDVFGGQFDRQELEIEVQPLDRRQNSFKLQKLTSWLSAEQALNDLRCNSSATKIQLGVPPYRK
jgi:hypothetical protein